MLIEKQYFSLQLTAHLRVNFTQRASGAKGQRVAAHVSNAPFVVFRSLFQHTTRIAFLARSAKKLSLRGEIKRRLTGRRPIPGHLQSR